MTVKLNHFKKYVFVVDDIAVLRELRPPHLVLVLQSFKTFSPTSAVVLWAMQLKKEKRKEKKVPLSLMLQQQVM